MNQCSKRAARANKFSHNYDPSQATNYILYQNLCRASMSEYLPQSDFRWLTDIESNTFDCGKISNNSCKVMTFHFVLRIQSHPTENI